MCTCGLAEHIVGQIQPATREPRPGNTGPGKPCSKLSFFEAAPLIDAIAGVDIGNELILNICPMPIKLSKRRRIDWHPITLHPRRCRHIAASQ
jgi:hypothetical protein